MTEQEIASAPIVASQENRIEIVKRKPTKKELEFVEMARENDIIRQITTLSIEQMNAIDILITGLSDREVAEKVGVTRQTVTSWRLYHPQFIAELGRRRQELWGFSADKIRSLLPSALEIVEQSLNDPTNPDRLKLAVEFLKQSEIFGTFRHRHDTDVMDIIKHEIPGPLAAIGQPSHYQIIDAMKRIHKRLEESRETTPDSGTSTSQGSKQDD